MDVRIVTTLPEDADLGRALPVPGDPCPRCGQRMVEGSGRKVVCRTCGHIVGCCE